MYRLPKNNIPPFSILCTLVPPIIPTLKLTLSHKLYEESSRQDSIHAQQNLSTYPLSTFVALCKGGLRFNSVM